MDCGKKSDFNPEMKTSKPLYKATLSPACGLNALRLATYHPL